MLGKTKNKGNVTTQEHLTLDIYLNLPQNFVRYFKYCIYKILYLNVNNPVHY